jgi:hypothetical protein
MSFYWKCVCATCSDKGPTIRVGGDAQNELKFVPLGSAEHTTSTLSLRTFLERHEYHDVRLIGEGAPRVS